MTERRVEKVEGEERASVLHDNEVEYERRNWRAYTELITVRIRKATKVKKFCLGALLTPRRLDAGRRGPGSDLARSAAQALPKLYLQFCKKYLNGRFVQTI